MLIKETIRVTRSTEADRELAATVGYNNSYILSHVTMANHFKRMVRRRYLWIIASHCLGSFPQRISKIMTRKGVLTPMIFKTTFKRKREIHSDDAGRRVDGQCAQNISNNIEAESHTKCWLFGKKMDTSCVSNSGVGGEWDYNGIY